ncbi:MAG TPA: AraC family transcriptional regulator [Agriterribacter sp.]|nr:AraC family transcriptional regulator [Agriterribacter sp.]
MGGSNHKPKERHFGETLFEQVVSFMQRNLKEPLSPERAAAEFKISATTLQRLFKKYGKMTFQHYLTDIRMERAKQLIKEGWRIKEVMYATGFKYRSTFNNTFQKKFGKPPGHFRK